MTTLGEFNKCGEDLERLMILRTSPLAIKLLEKESDIPEGAIRPKRDRGYHLAQCQAFAMSRREKTTVAMLKEDNWCWASLIAYGLVEKPQDPNLAEHTAFPCLEYGKYIGIVSAPLKTANFEPDVVLIYSNTAQLRNMLLASKFQERDQVIGHFFPPACSYAIVPVVSTGGYRVMLPDPGEYERALTGEDEIMLSMPADKIAGLVAELWRFEEVKFGYNHSNMFMRPDFPQPDFYKMLFKRWGLDSLE
jgi:uncharacterized protein (DUF169 family)